MTDSRISFLTREQWGAEAPNHAHLSTRRDLLAGITFHHTTGANLGDVDTAQWARNVQRFCMVTRGYGDIEYNAMIRAYVDPHDGRARGVFVACRDIAYVGAHALSAGNQANRTTTGVALMGDSRDVLAHPLLAPMVRELVGLCWYFQVLYANAHHLGHPLHYGHRDWIPHGGTPTLCPGDPLAAMVGAL